MKNAVRWTVAQVSDLTAVDCDQIFLAVDDKQIAVGAEVAEVAWAASDT